jgi:hypothetical protein
MFCAHLELGEGAAPIDEAKAGMLFLADAFTYCFTALVSPKYWRHI